MWIVAVIISSIAFFMMYINGLGREATLLIAGVSLALVVRLGSLSNKLQLKINQLEKKYNNLEEKLESLKAPKITEVEEVEISQPLIKEIVIEEKIEEPIISKTKAKTEVDYFQNMINKKEGISAKVEIKESSSEPMVPKVVNSILKYFTKGNPLVKVGGVLLFFGLSFLIKFAAEQDMISIEMGLACVIAFSFVLIGIGWKKRNHTASFGLILQGIGIAVFYLSIFSSAKYFEIIPFSLALGIMVITVIFASFLAVAQNSMTLAIFATAGGFISPILTSTGEGSHIVLFSYYALLNIGIVSIAWFKSWRPLNLIGFTFTFVISALWGSSRYVPEFFWSTEPFLIFFFLLYIVVVIIFAFKSEYKLKAYVDSTLLFGVPVTAFAMQGALVKSYDYALSFSALAVAFLYLILAWTLRKKEHMSVLAESFLALGVVFITLAIPFAVSEHWTAVTWALESTAIIWISLRQNRVYSRYFAIVLQIVAGLMFFNESKYILVTTFIFNNIFLGGILISMAAFITSFVFEKFSEKLQTKENILRYVFMGIALAWLLFLVVVEFRGYFEYYQTYFLAFISVCAILFAILSKKLQWKTLEEMLIGFWPLGLVILVTSLYMFEKTHPFVGIGWLAIPLFILTHYFLLYKFEFKTKDLWHVAGLWLAVGIFTWEMTYNIAKVSAYLSYASYPLFSILSILLITPKRNFWPLNAMYKTYHNLGLAGVSFLLIIFNLYLFGNSGFIKEWTYIPFVNPLDIMQVVSIIAIIYWLHSLKDWILAPKKIMYIFMGIGIVAMLNVVLARSIHAFVDVKYTIHHLLQSYVFQASLSIMYSLLALVLIIIAKRKESRTIWIVGASLLGFVTLKLFFVELSHSGTLSRIVSFMAVGILILIIGYLAPLPPKKQEELTS